MLLAGPGAGEEGLVLRREYNQVAAAIDTLAGQYGKGPLAALTREGRAGVQIPAGMRLVLIFWADDEAVIRLNGYPVSQTRLAPVQVEIPASYLRGRNLLQAHCWDTDRVESGFMAGLYLKDGQGGLHPVLVSREEGWRTAEGRAQEIFYTHSQPDIPGARVIWGDKLFGQVWLETEFDSSYLNRAARSGGVAISGFTPQERPMELHQVVGRLVQLQERRQELARQLAAQSLPSRYPERYQEGAQSGLAFALGKAALLAETPSLETAARVQGWAARLTPQEKELVWREGRSLKGVQAATLAREYQGGASGKEDRRADYMPPPEKGPVGEPGKGGMRGEGRVAVRLVRRIRPELLWLAVAGLTGYIGGAGTWWWRLFRGKVWRI